MLWLLALAAPAAAVPRLVKAGGEQGLLSIAFAPDYDKSGRLYVFYTSARSGHNRVNIVRYTGSTSDPLKADPNSATSIFSARHDSPEHNGGQLQFGPDRMLWASIGDNQISPNAQDVANNPFGKILRLDPATGKAAAGNPHRRVWAYGLRNPWRFSFDRLTGDLIIGDVGESAWEEINWGRAPGRARNVNFGRPNTEGVGTFGEIPVIARDHTVSDAIIGGYVVRDPGLPTLNGRYVYGDLGHPQLRSARPRSGADDKPLALAVLLAAHDRRTVNVKVPRATLSRLRARLDRGHVARLRVRIRAVDPVGNRRTVSRTRRVKG